MKVKTNRHGASVFLRFKGTAVKLMHPVQSNGGFADLYVDGVHYKRVSFSGNSTSFGHLSAINGLADI